MPPGTSDRAWLSLGNAQIIDWRHLDKEAPARGATAWVGPIGDDTFLVRTWCEETTTHFDFSALAHGDVAGRVSVFVSRPSPGRASIKVDVELPSRIAYREVVELTEHPRTGLQGAVTREIEVELGRFDPAPTAAITPSQAEIFEYAPESALQTDCGRWLSNVLEVIHAFVVEEGLDVSEAAAPEPEPPRREPEPPRREPEPPRREPEPPRREPEPPRREAPAARRPHIPAEPTPVREPTPTPTPVPAGLPRLFASTNGGETWELNEDETYIGRSKQCSVVLKSQRVSRKHASVTREADGWFINDLGAANGIWAGTDKIDRELIEDKSEYIIGDVLLTFTFS